MGSEADNGTDCVGEREPETQGGKPNEKKWPHGECGGSAVLGRGDTFGRERFPSQEITRKVIGRRRAGGHMLWQEKAEQTCCRLGNGKDGCQHPGLHDGLLSLAVAKLLLLLRTPLPENNFHLMVGNKSINPSEQGKSRTLNHSYQVVPGKAGASQKAGLGILR